MGRRRVILAIDFDAFYCGVEEKRDPSLVDTPFIVYQKNCIATLSYAARNLGLKKLGFVTEAVRKYPDIKLINGESLAPYREQGKALWQYVKTLVPGATIERLGLEEMWIDVTDIVNQNLEKLVESDVLFRDVDAGVEDGLDQGWHLDLTTAGGALVEHFDFNPEADIDNHDNSTYEEQSSTGFLCEDFFFQSPATIFPSSHGSEMPSFLQTDNPDPEEFYMDFKLYIASHIAREIMLKVSLCMGFSCSIGIATNKTLAKMVGSINKPRGLTLLVSSATQEFMNSCHVKKIPWFGTRARSLLRLGMPQGDQSDDDLKVSTVLARFDGDGKEFKRLFPPPQGEKLWELLHGIDENPVKETTAVQTQVSIENTYKTVTTFALAEAALLPIVESLLTQLTQDMIEPDTNSWVAYPTVIRIGARFATSLETLKGRVSHSQTLTTFAPFYKLCEMHTEGERNKLARSIHQLVVVPMLRQLLINNSFSPSAPHIHFQLLNVTVTGMSNMKPKLSYALKHSAPNPHVIRKNLDHYFSKAPKK